MIFRPASQNDLVTLASMDKEANRTPWSLHGYQESFNDSNHYILCLCEDNEIIGYCVYSIVIGEAEILQLVVRKSSQNNGYGYLLFKHLCDKLTSLGVEQIFLEVMVGNTSAINLYHKLGFNVVGNRKNYYKVDGKFIDAILMAKASFDFGIN